MTGDSRRAVLAKLGLLGTASLTGCQTTTPDSNTPTGSTAPSTDEPTSRGRATDEQSGTTADAGTVSFDLDVTEATGNDASQVTVTGTITSNRPLETIRVVTSETETTVDVGAVREAAVDVSLDVGGGRAYKVVVTAIDDAGASARHRLDTDHVPIHIDPLSPDRLVGAHYYPWYGTGSHVNWTDRTVSTPVLGEYVSDDRAVVDQHLKWCLEHGIKWLSVSWWGPDSGTGQNLSNELVEMRRFQDVAFSILYETKGRLEPYDYDLSTDGAIDRLRSDFQHLADEYFDRENYRTLDGRPVVFVYIAQTLHGDVAAAFQAVADEIGVEPYILADVPFGSAPATYPIMDVADGITSYNPYSPREDIEDVFHEQYAQGNKVLELGADAADVDYVPVVIPGFNDTGLPDHIREDNPILSSSPERYDRVLKQVTPHLDSAAGVLVTSFNEWYENTQIEPSENDDTAYLEATAELLATGESPGYEFDGSRCTLSFNETVVPSEQQPDSEDDRELAFMASALAFYDDGDPLVTYDIGTSGQEPLFLKGAFGPGSNETTSWRWLGGPDAETILLIDHDLSSADRLVLTGQPIASDQITATVSLDGTDHGTVDFGARDGHDPYTIDLA